MAATARKLKQAIRGASDPWGAINQAIENIMAVVNSRIPSANLTMEKGTAPTLPGSAVAAGSALTLTAAAHGGRLIQLDTAAGSTVTLPAASGSGVEFTFVVSALATSNSHIVKVANASDTMIGFALSSDTDTSDAFAGFNATATSDTITLNRSTTGSVRTGEFIRVKDILANKWAVEVYYTATGAPATPFSATVA